MTIVYSTKENEKEFVATKPDYEYEFVSPTHTGVVHWAHRVVILGSYPAIEERYAGIMPVEVIALKPKKDATK